jgi:CMP-N,N'-diacetyllegionaminic acid synthase
MSKNKIINNCCFFIPAREGSKGVQFKNRKLFSYTIDSIPEQYRNLVYISTDDDVIKKQAIDFNINVVDRPKELATDTSSVKDVMEHFIKTEDISPNTNIILLYLTYPERTWEDILKIYELFLNKNAKSLVCAEDVEKHPYLCFYELDDMKGKFIVNHSLYRRQDYPKCIKISLFVACYKANVVNKLHDLLVEDDTLFYKLSKNKLDIDLETDLKLFEETK